MGEEMFLVVWMVLGILAWMVMAWLMTAVVGHVVAKRLGGQGGFGLLLLNLIPALAVPASLRYAAVIVMSMPRVSLMEALPGLPVLMLGIGALAVLYTHGYHLSMRTAVIGASLTMFGMGMVSVVLLVPAAAIGLLLVPVLVLMLPLLAFGVVVWGVIAIWRGLRRSGRYLE